MLRLRTRSMSDGSGIADRNAADIFAYIVADMRGPARLSIPNTPSALFLSVLTSSKMRIYCGASKNHRQREKNSHSRSQKIVQTYSPRKIDTIALQTKHLPLPEYR